MHVQKNNLKQNQSFSLIKLISLFLAFGLIFSCASNPEDDTKSIRDSRLSPDEAAKTLFERGENYMNLGNFESAARYFEQLETQYPLSKLTRQAQINLIYSHYKRKDSDRAVDAAKQFIKENPVNKQLDYVYYLLGLIHFDKESGRFENLFRINRNKRPQNDMQDSMEYFQTLISKYPQSKYVDDSKQRIIFIRERLANHELNIAQYYARRAIYVAAVNRAKNVLEEYPDTQAARQALDVLEVSYKGLGMDELASDIQRIKASN